jgi:D-serine deaminase-like pyridoxal phosphate-dependent protein
MLKPTESAVSKQLDRIETPAAIVDLHRASANAARVCAYLRDHGLGWRPHVKTHKSVEVARIQIEAGAAGLTVATLHEAEVMCQLGVDLLLAHPPVGRAKESRLSGLLQRTPLTVALDSGESLATVARAGADGGQSVPVLVELDVGMGRVGITDPGELTRLASLAEERATTSFAGLLFYPGHIRMSSFEQGPALTEIAERLGTAIETLSRAGLTPGIVSGGSTPTLWRSHEIPGLTEVRAGTCIFHDRDSVALGAGTSDDIAYHVLATVVSAHPDRAVVDAGSKALAREEFRAGGGGYGLLPDHPEVRLVSLSEEHGILDLTSSQWRPAVGDRVRIVPNHVCVSVNLQDRLFSPGPNGLRPVHLEGRGRQQ